MMLKSFDAVDELISPPEFPHVTKVSNYKKDALRLAIPSKSPEEFNEKGYRADSFSKRAGLRVLSIGCSDVFGYGIERGERFSDLFCEHFARRLGCEVANWNLGLPGKSNDYISRMVDCAQKILNPDIILVCFTRIIRREWFSPRGECCDHIYRHKNESSAHFEGLSSYNDNIINFYKNYRLVECCAMGKPFYFTLSLNTAGEAVGMNDILRITDQSRYVGYFDLVDKADDSHPGRMSNRDLATRFIKRHEAGE